MHDFDKCTVLKSILFADDCTLMVSAKNNEELQNIINTELEKVNNWFEDNGLSLHPSKTQFMTFRDNTEIEVFIKGNKIEQTGSTFPKKSVNILGILWDSRLKWDEHINKVLNRVSTGKYLISRFKKQLPSETRVLLYESLIRSHLLYGLQIWGNSNCREMNKLRTMIKKCLRLIDDGKVHTKPVQRKYGILYLKDEYKRSLRSFSWDVYNKIAPKAIQDDFELANTRQLRVNKKVKETRFKDELLKEQLLGKIEKTINALSLMELRESKRKMIRNFREQQINKYPERVVCVNIGCKECR